MSDRNRLAALLVDRKISTRIGLGFAFVLVVLAVVSGMAWHAFRSSAEGFATYAQRVTVVGIARDIDRDFVVLRPQASSQTVAQSADSVGRTADVLRSELTQFLEAMAKTDDTDRRRYERIPGNGAEATLRPSGGVELRAPIIAISRGGVSLRTDWSAPAGTGVRVMLPGSQSPVTARIARTKHGVLALAFRQGETMLRRIDIALARVGPLTTHAQAA